MTQLAALHVKITGDSSDAILESSKLVNAMNRIDPAIQKVNRNMAKLGPTMKTSMRGAAGGLNDFNKAARTARFQSANMFAQFQDIGVMIASGQSPFILAAQQGSQISQILQTIGGTGKEQFAALRAAAMSFISPMNLITVGTVAIVAGLVQWGIAAASAGEDMDRLAEAVENARDRAIELEVQIRELESGRSRDYLALWDNYNQKLQESADILNQHNAAIEKGGRGFQDRVDAAWAASDAAWEELKAFEAQEERLKELKKIEEQRNKAIRDAEAAFKEVEEYLETAVGSTAELSENMRKAADEAVRMVAAGQVGPDTVRAQLYDEGRLGGAVVGGEVLDNDEDKPKKGKTDPLKGNLERLQERLMSELELEKHMHEERQKILEAALEKKYITQQEYGALEERLNSEHQKKMAQIDVWRYGSTLDKTGTFLGDMEDAFASGNASMLDIAKKFGAAQAFISAWQGAAEALKLPFPANLAAFAKVLATGIAAVNAIKGASPGGGGPTSVGGTSGPTDAGSIAGGPASGPQVTRSLTLIGESFNRKQAIAMAEFLNEGTDDGLVIRGN